MTSRSLPHIRRASVEAARALLADRVALETVAAGVSVEPGYEGDWDVDHGDVKRELGEISVRVRGAETLLEEDFFDQLYCRIGSTETDESGSFDESEEDYYSWGNQHEVTADDIAHALEITIEVVEREGWVID